MQGIRRRLPLESRQIEESSEAEMMWMLLARAPTPDAAYWPGRRLLALADAVLWPVALVAALCSVPVATGVVLPVATALAAINALVRAHTALAANHRYRFTTWRLARVAVVLMIIGVALKIGTGWR
jgi:hypothetical protein